MARHIARSSSRIARASARSRSRNAPGSVADSESATPVDPVEGPEQVDGGRPAGPEVVRRRLHGRPDRLDPPAERGLAPDHGAERGGDPDRRGAPDPERPDRLPDRRDVAALDLDELGRAGGSGRPGGGSPIGRRRPSRPSRGHPSRLAGSIVAVPRRPRPPPTPRGRSTNRTRSRGPRCSSRPTSCRPT